MKEWILSIGATVIIVEIIALILPEGKIGKYIKGIFTLVVMIVILQPLLNFSLDKLPLNELGTNITIDYQDNYLDYVINTSFENKEQDLVKMLSYIGIDNSEIDIEYQYEIGKDPSIKKVEINLKNAVINSDKEHIDIIEEVKAVVSEYLSIDKGVLILYE